jgi:hypothetical protein
MKQKQLKQIIKENIKYILSESDNPTLEKIIIRFVKKYSKEWGLSMYDTFRGIQRKMDQMEDQFGEGEYDPQSRTYVSPKFTEPLGEDMQYAPQVDGVYIKKTNMDPIPKFKILDADLLVSLSEMGRWIEVNIEDPKVLPEYLGLDVNVRKLLRSIAYGDVNEQEDDIEPTADDINKADSIASKGNKLQSLIKKMKSKAKEYKKAEGDKKESIKKELKKMTTEKNKLEASI